MRIGVFICHCGSNIGGTVDCAKVAETARAYPDVVYAVDLMYSCAEPGQAAIEAAIHEHKLDGVVVASCSPRMHEPTFRRTVERAGLNRYMFEMANIREHVSWIGKDKVANTNKAAELVEMAVAKLRNNKPLFSKSFDINKRVLIIGGGFSGSWAALTARQHVENVLIVDKGPRDWGGLGGMSGGDMIVKQPEFEASDLVDELTYYYDGLCEQDVLEEILNLSYDRFMDLERMGHRFHREDGELQSVPQRGLEKMRYYFYHP